MRIPTIEDVQEATKRIKPFIKRTPVLTSNSINQITQSEIFFKCENFQKVGAFKFRGATNAVFSLIENEAKKGVATHSSGNHAQALALAAKICGIPATIVMPDNSPKIKKDAVAGYGAEIIFCEPTLEARESILEKVINEKGPIFIHPYHNFNVIAGAGTAGKELVEDIPDLDYVITPVGGGGLLSGTSISVKALSANTKVIAAEPEGADDAYRSLQTGRIIPSVNPNTICDGLLTSLSERTFKIVSQNVSDIITVSDKSTIAAMRLIWERMKIIVEPSAAITLGMLLENKTNLKGKRIGIIISGGNVDLEKLPWKKC
ncbi:pyridoxal-phosphate dependent enzyme [Bacteroidota bacterium]